MNNDFKWLEIVIEEVCVVYMYYVVWWLYRFVVICICYV